MTHHRLIFAAVLTTACAVAAGPATQPAPASVRARVARVVDHRFARLSPDATTTANPDLGLTVSLQLAGLPDLTTATGYGHWAVTAAADDRGTNVAPMTLPNAADDGSTPRKQADRYEDVDRNATDGLKPGPDGFALQTFDVQLGVAARGAAALRRLSGHVDLIVGGTDHVARFDHPTRLVGQTLADADLRAAGVSVTFDRPDPADRPPKRPQVTFHFHGDPALLHDDMLDVVGPDGKTVVDSSVYFGAASDTPHPRTYDLTRPLDDTMTITVRVPLGQRTVRVPFDLRDVPLP